MASIVLIVGLLLGYYWFASPSSSQGETVTIAVTPKDHVRGAQDAKLTLVEFGDFQCPACGAYEPLVSQVVKDNAKNVKFVFKHFPLMQMHHNALLAAKASEAAALQGKFWEMHDKLYEKQEEWGNTLNAREYIMSYATTIGLDVAKFTKDIESKAIEEKILAELKEGSTLGVQGTPTFFLNGKKLDNPRSLAAFNDLIKTTLEASK